MQEKTVRQDESHDIGFVGGGTIAGWHAERVRALGGNIASVADIAPDARRSFAEQHAVDARFEDYETMVADMDLDVVVVAVPNALHADCVIAALDADQSVLVEKPLAHTLESGERIAAAEAASDGEVMVGLMKAFDPGIEMVGESIDRGDFGSIYEVNVEYVRQRGIPQIGSWFTRKSVSGGGAVVDIGPHMLHLALSVLGFPEIETVSATAGSHFGSKEEYTYLDMWGGDPIDDAHFDVEDHARALIRTTEGTAIHLNVAWASNRESVQHVHVLGDEAGATLAPSEDGITINTTKNGCLSSETLRHTERDPYAAEWQYFFDVLDGEREHTRNTVDEGLAVQRIIDAIYRSAEHNEEIRLA